MHCLAKKTNLCENLNVLSEYCDTDFSPKSWVLPSDLKSFKETQGSEMTYIVKPELMS